MPVNRLFSKSIDEVFMIRNSDSWVTFKNSPYISEPLTPSNFIPDRSVTKSQYCVTKKRELLARSGQTYRRLNIFNNTRREKCYLNLYRN